MRSLYGAIVNYKQKEIMVSIDRVYQKVLALANKEQRGYITPQEFNLFAHHAQMEIFEQYFYDLNQFLRTPGNSAAYSDMVTNLEEKISIFERYDQEGEILEPEKGIVRIQFFSFIHRLGMVRVRYDSGNIVEAEELQLNEINKYAYSPLGRWSETLPVYTRYSGDYVANADSRSLLRVYPNPNSVHPSKPISNVLLSYVQTPRKPNWAYNVINNKPLYNSTDAIDFELHDSEEVELVYKILLLAGVAIEKPELTQSAAGLNVSQIQQEKQ